TRTLHVTLPQSSKVYAREVVVRRQPTPRDQTLPPRVSSTPPFAHMIATTASDEAQRQLARLVLVPPYTADATAMACQATVVWRESRYEGATEVLQQIAAFSSEVTLVAPFALDPQLRSQRWEAQVQFDTGGELTTTTLSGPPIHPPIQRWRLRYAGREDWQVAQPDSASYRTITEPYNVPLDVTVAQAVEAVAVIALAEQATIWLDAWTNGGLTLAVDGVETDSVGEPRTELLGVERPWPVTRYGPVTLPAGVHTFTARVTAPDGSVWVFGVLLVDGAGNPLVCCTHVLDETHHEMHHETHHAS
ncbi:MAG: hypothetical protein ACRDHP_20425, partial [Ktedonobacterales bacterium]